MSIAVKRIPAGPGQFKSYSREPGSPRTVFSRSSSTYERIGHSFFLKQKSWLCLSFSEVTWFHHGMAKFINLCYADKAWSSDYHLSGFGLSSTSTTSTSTWYFLNACYVPGTVLEAGDTEVRRSWLLRSIHSGREGSQIIRKLQHGLLSSIRVANLGPNARVGIISHRLLAILLNFSVLNYLMY